ncbi:hypothetical protein G647_03712 [Cladophialophora carrionii CBS 160.54]|uniref:Zn(2)-C6 fungal-type domain-containing protein n=1 Tax=Cladophialophora carrionii CBS 160.54 TaxID=1279043 RepID=V9DDD5_9EURO|nr:uncharacterized protein G647_03712 [Cladophialophora carrionii CBS 160.54]ETI24343.1 hypothetical protein G647_03712 [Cladophialophora carrionii CBS 160.54]
MTTAQSPDRIPRPVVVREEIVPGRGVCYVYDDGTRLQKSSNTDAVNPKWGTTKAGKPRKRLGQACNTCREKKIKCDPSTPKCIQCQKFSRECKFDTGPRPTPRPSDQLPSMPTTSPLMANAYIQNESSSRRGSTASADPLLQDHPSCRAAPRSSIQIESLLSPASRDDDSRDESPDNRPPAKKLRMSLSPHPASDGWPAESVGSESWSGSVESPSTIPKFSWAADPYEVDREMTLYYANKYFNHVDGATTCILPRKGFLRWVKECTTKTSMEKMLLYAVLAMGTVFSHHAGTTHHQDLFIDIVNNAVLETGNTFTLQLVQTKLILGLFAFSQGQNNRAWDFCGSALRIALGLQYHTEEGVASVDAKTGLEFGLNYATLMECRRRAFWAAYIMDCFNACCSMPITSVSRAECHLRLPCSQPAYQRGEIPTTPFSLSTEPDEHSASGDNIAQVGVLGYLVEVATIFKEVMRRISKNKPEASEGDRLSMEAFQKDALRRLDAWDPWMRKHLHQVRDGREPVNGLHILYHYTAMLLHRHMRYSEASKVQIVENVRGAFKHARLMMVMVQELSNHEEKETPSFRFATLSPFSGYAITAALDVITAAGTMADLMDQKSRIMSLLSSGIEALEGLADFWESARRQREMIKKRFGVLLVATNKACDFNGAFYFGESMQSPFDLDQDIVYGLPRPQYLEALGWDDRIHRDEDFHQLDKPAETTTSRCS